MVHSQLTLKHLTDHNIIIKEQYGFKTKPRTDNAAYC